MTGYQAYLLEKYTSTKGVESEAAGLVYFTDANDPRIAISGKQGITILTRKQAKALVGELIDIMDLYCGRG